MLKMPASALAAEFASNLIKETSGLRQDRSILGGRKIAEKLFLFLTQLAGNLDEDLHQLIAGALAAQIGQTLAAQLENFPVLRAGRNFHLLPAIERRHGDLRAQ